MTTNVVAQGMSQECEDGSQAEVVLIEPPCLVAERECEVDIHFSREVHVRKMALTRDGTLMADAPSAPQMTKTRQSKTTNNAV